MVELKKKGVDFLKLIVIEGTDGSGKETQTKLLCEKLEKEGYKVKKITFPNYESESSGPVKMYLAGKFGNNAMEVNPYPISTMYAIDRYASFKEDWEKDYNNENTIVIADRYTTSNMLHQGTKLEGEEQHKYIEWLKDLEYKKMNLPEPMVVFFLDMPTKCAESLRKSRLNKITGEEKKDIHEKDIKYMERVYNKGKIIALNEEWEMISCTGSQGIKTIEEINEEILKKLKWFV